MKKNFLTGKILPYLVAVLSFIIICALYFKPQYDGMALRQGDMVQVSAMKADITDHKETYGENPQWTGNMFGGMPSTLIEFPFEGRYIQQTANGLYFLKAPAAYIFIAMLGFFFMLLCFRVNPWLSMVGAIAYGLSSYFLIIINAGHITKMVTLAYAPALVGAVYYTYRRNIWIGGALTGIFAALEIGANHIQITYYFFYVLLAMAINEGIRSWKNGVFYGFLKRSAVLLGAAVLALGANAIQLHYIYDYAKDSIRGGTELTHESGETPSGGLTKEYATSWSYGKMETFNLFIPNLMGGSSSGGFSDNGPVAQALMPYGQKQIAPYLPGYWGGQPHTDGPVYVGAVMIFLFVLALFLLCRYKKWWVLAVTALSLLLAWGHNLMWFTDIFFDFVPFYNKFRTVSMILVIAEWSVPLLAILVLQKLWNGSVPKERFIKSLKYAVYITGGVALFFLIFGPFIFDFTGAVDANYPPDIVSAMIKERTSLLRGDSFRSLAFILLTAGVVWAFYEKKLRKGPFVAVMVVLVLIDMVGVDKRYLNYDTFVPVRQAQAIEPSPANLAIMQDTDPSYRVFNTTGAPFMDAITSNFHRSVGGYHAAKLQRYQDLIDRHLSRGNWNVFNMLNTRYIIAAGENGELVAQYNPGALGAAWFVDRVQFVPNADAEIEALNDFEPETTAIVDERFRETVGSHTSAVRDSAAVIELVDYKVNHLTYSVESNADAIAVFSEIYYPKGWTAYLDGQEAPYFRADYVLRAMIVPAGKHTIEFVYSAPDFNRWKSITAICSSILLVSLLGAIGYGIFRANKKTEPETEKK